MPEERSFKKTIMRKICVNFASMMYRGSDAKVKHNHVPGCLCKLGALLTFTYVHTFQWVIKHAVA